MERDLRTAQFDLETLMKYGGQAVADVLDRAHIDMKFESNVGYPMDWENPVTFNQKLQVLKLRQRDPLLRKVSDKYTVRSYLTEMGLSSYLNELYGVYDNAQQFKDAFEGLPDSFVVKASHWSGGNLVVPEKLNMDWAQLDRIDQILPRSYYNHRTRWQSGKDVYMLRNGEWNYSESNGKLLVEAFLHEEHGELRDYKFYCFGGEPKYVKVDFERSTNHTCAFWDMDWNKMDFAVGYPRSECALDKPSNLPEMIDLARRLSEGFPFLRVDLYNVDQRRIIFGEMTFYHGSGMRRFTPAVWDRRFGDLIKIEDL